LDIRRRRALGTAATIGGMPSTSAVARLVLVLDPRPVASSARARRYRLARLDLNPGPRSPDAPFEHLKRVYD
jgi:hypothetical protein